MIADGSRSPSAPSLDDLMNEAQRVIGEFVIVSETIEWAVYTHKGVVRDCTLASAMATALTKAGLKLMRMADTDYELLSAVVSKARTHTGSVVIPVDLFSEIQARVADVEAARKAERVVIDAEWAAEEAADELPSSGHGRTVP